MKIKFKDLKYYKFNVFFYYLLRQNYKIKRGLDLKLYTVYFFLKLELRPSLNYWSPVKDFFFNFPDRVSYFAETFGKSKRGDFTKFKIEPVNILLTSLHHALYVWIYLPKFLSDIYKYYPEFKLSLDDREIIYIDYWMSMPKIIEELLSELLIRDTPLTEKYMPIEPSTELPLILRLMAENDKYKLESYLSPKDMMYMQHVNPGVKESTKENHKKNIINDNLKDEIFQEILNFWLLNKLKNPINLNPKLNDLAIKNYIVLDVILSKVNTYTLSFLEANTYSKEGILSAYRNRELMQWKNLTDEERTWYITVCEKRLQSHIGEN
jgi:hypothetical protein